MMAKKPKRKSSMYSLTKQAKGIVAKKLLERPMPKKPHTKQMVRDY